MVSRALVLLTAILLCISIVNSRSGTNRQADGFGRVVSSDGMGCAAKRPSCVDEDARVRIHRGWLYAADRARQLSICRLEGDCQRSARWRLQLDTRRSGHRETASCGISCRSAKPSGGVRLLSPRRADSKFLSLVWQLSAMRSKSCTQGPGRTLICFRTTPTRASSEPSYDEYLDKFIESFVPL